MKIVRRRNGRRYRMAPYAAARAAGSLARMAYRNRGTIARGVKRAANAMKRMYKRPRRSSQTNAVRSGPGNTQRVKPTVIIGRKKRLTLSRLQRQINASRTREVYRFQGLTNFDVNVGYFSLPNWLYGPAGSQVSVRQMPIHIYNLTSMPNVTTYKPAQYFQWETTQPDADIIRGDLRGQEPASFLTAGVWNTTEKSETNTLINAANMYHHWSDIRFNFYGPRKRTTKFTVLFFRVKDEFADPFDAAGTNLQFKQLMTHWDQPRTFSNLNVNNTYASKYIDVVKTCTYWTNAGETTDVNNTVGKVTTAKIFMRHDRQYNLSWKRNQLTDNFNPEHGTADYGTTQRNMDTPLPRSRLYMAVMAHAPEQTADKTAYPGTGADALTDPSYDLVIRNCISTP